eukprot:COSAG06_NODE_12875_length_1317_cov_1.504926_1_plen_247_part_00
MSLGTAEATAAAHLLGVEGAKQELHSKGVGVVGEGEAVEGIGRATTAANQVMSRGTVRHKRTRMCSLSALTVHTDSILPAFLLALTTYRAAVCMQCPQAPSLDLVVVVVEVGAIELATTAAPRDTSLVSAPSLTSGSVPAVVGRAVTVVAAVDTAIGAGIMAVESHPAAVRAAAAAAATVTVTAIRGTAEAGAIASLALLTTPRDATGAERRNQRRRRRHGRSQRRNGRLNGQRCTGGRFWTRRPE